jgi:hypothetical protein
MKARRSDDIFGTHRCERSLKQPPDNQGLFSGIVERSATAANWMDFQGDGIIGLDGEL